MGYGNRVKLLIVEDEKPTAAFLRRGLSEEGFAVEVAAAARSADELVQINDYDVIVVDVRLPSGDGFSLCQQWWAVRIKNGVRLLKLLLSSSRSLSQAKP